MAKSDLVKDRKALEEETPIWKDPPFIFGIALFPSIVVLCWLMYLIHTLFLE